MLRLAGPRYLGPALSAGAVYIGTAHDTTAEVICFKGNMVTGSGTEDKENLYAQPLRKKT